MVTRRDLLGGLTGLGAGFWTVPSFAQAMAPEVKLDIRYGWDADIAGPTEATFHVAPNGDDAAEGSEVNPVRTVQRGVDLLAARAGGSLAIHAGVYRESVTLDALRGTAQNPYTIHRYGRDRVTISAANPLTGWTPCPEDEAKALGLPANGIFVARLPMRSIQHGTLSALNLHEAGQWRSIAVDRADMSDPETIGDDETYHSAPFTLDAEDRILSIRDPRLRGMPPAWMQNVEVLVYHLPNLVATRQIAHFDPTGGEIVMAGKAPKVQRIGGTAATRYALRGAPWALKKGTWIVRQTSPDEASVYFWPLDPASLAKDVEVSLRPVCIEVGGGRHIEFFGIEAVRAAGDGGHSAICIYRKGLDGDPEAGSHLKFTHCRVGDAQSTGTRGRGALALRDSDNLILRNVTVENVRGGFGFFLGGCDKADVRFLHVVNASNSPARFFTLRNFVFAFSLLQDSGRDAHSNKFNFYEGSDAVLVYGVRCKNVRGYVTYSKASRINFAFCDLPCDPNSYNRALVSQNRSLRKGQKAADDSGEPVFGSTFYYWNNSLTSEAIHAKRASALHLGPESTSQRHVIHNNILHGGGFATIYTGEADPALEERSDNRYTGLSFWQTPRYGWSLKQGEEIMRVGGRIHGSGKDMRLVISTELAPLFPSFTHWDLDIDGRAVDWTAPPFGCRV